MRLENGEVLLAWPLEQHSLTAGMYYEDGAAHNAIDLACRWGSDTAKQVCAAEAGRVVWVQQWDGHTKTGVQSYGNAVLIRHGDYRGRMLETLYAHLSRIDVQQDQQVAEGQQIGTTGSTGNSTGPHLHFEVRWAGKRYNPLCWLDDDFTITPGWNPYTYGKGEHAVQRPQSEGVWGRGIDLSKHNWVNRAPVNFAKVRKAGAKFAILRAGYGRFAHQVDSYFNRAYGEAKAAGLAVGAYWYSYAVSEEEARKEAQLFADTVKDKQLTMGLWFDQEYEPGILALTNAQRTALVKAFCAEVQRLTGKSCGLYCSRDWINTKLDAPQLMGTELWVAAYTGTDSPGAVALSYGIWQYVGGAGSWPGVDGPCDLNLCYKDYPALYGTEESEDITMVFKPLSWHRLTCLTDKPACEIFGSTDTNDVLDKLSAGQVLQVIAEGDTVELGSMTATWYQCNHMGYPAPVYVLALPDRCKVVNDEDEPAPAPTPERVTITGKGSTADLLRACADWLEDNA